MITRACWWVLDKYDFARLSIRAFGVRRWLGGFPQSVIWFAICSIGKVPCRLGLHALATSYFGLAARLVLGIDVAPCCSMSPLNDSLRERFLESERAWIAAACPPPSDLAPASCCTAERPHPRRRIGHGHEFPHDGLMHHTVRGGPDGLSGVSKGKAAA